MSKKWPLDLVDDEVTGDFKEQFLRSSKEGGIQRVLVRNTYLEPTMYQILCISQKAS